MDTQAIASRPISARLVPPAVDRTPFSPQFTDTITGSPTERDDGGFSELSRQVKQAGLLDRRSASDKVRMGVNALLLAVGWTAFMVIGDSWYQLIVAVYLALVLGQILSLIHISEPTRLGMISYA